MLLLAGATVKTVAAHAIATQDAAASQPASNTPSPADVQAAPTTPMVKDTALSQDTPTSTPQPTVAVERRLPRPAAPEKEVTIPATVGRGNAQISLGLLKKGQTVTFQYVRGEWTNWPNNPVGSPDDPVPKNPNVTPVSICEKKGQTVEKIADIPHSTKDKPFVFTAPHDIEELVLNMDDDKAANNKGEVVYRVQIK